MPPILSILEQEVERVSRLLELLRQEQAALKAGTPESLPQIGEAKDLLIEQLNALEDKRNQALGEPQGTRNQTGMGRWLEANPGARDCAQRWEQLLKLAREAKQMHELNSRLLTLHLQRTNAALAVLTGRDQRNSLYGSDGQTSQFTGSRIVDSA